MFGADTNKKGFKVPRGCGVIQGDGVTYEGIVRLLDAVLEAGFSAEVCCLAAAGEALRSLERRVCVCSESGFVLPCVHVVLLLGDCLLWLPPDDSRAVLAGV